MDTCYERPEKYIVEALNPILEFLRYRMYDNCAVREFYSVLKVAIKGARAVGLIGLLLNNQMIPKIMPFTNWKEWNELLVALSGYTRI